MLIPRLFFRIGVAIAFSPRREAMLAEARRFRDLFGAELAIIIIGEKQEHRANEIETLLIQNNIDPEEIHLIWEEPQGNTAKQIVEICHANQIDLLLAGALRNEQRLSYSMGNIARQILLTAPCSVMVLLEPKKYPSPIVNLVAMEHKGLKGYHPFTNLIESLATMPDLKRIDYLVEMPSNSLLMNLMEKLNPLLSKSNKLKRIKLTLQRRKQHLKDLPENIKLVLHATGNRPELKTATLAQKIQAQLLVMRAPLIERAQLNNLIFKDSFKYLIQNLPCNLLILRNK